MDQIITVIALSLATSIISVTISRMAIFEGFRSWIIFKLPASQDFIQCFYCLSFWVAFGLVLIYHPQILKPHIAVLDIFLSTFIIMCLSTFISVGIIKSLESIE